LDWVRGRVGTIRGDQQNDQEWSRSLALFFWSRNGAAVKSLPENRNGVWV